MAKITCNIISQVLKRTVDITVIIPTPTIPDALERNGKRISYIPAEKYPVIYLLHGFGNNHATWSGYTNVELYEGFSRFLTGRSIHTSLDCPWAATGR